MTDNYRSESKARFVLESYRAIKFHFGGSFDFFKYHGKFQLGSKLKLEFESSKEYWYCVSIAKGRTKGQIINLILSNILYDPSVWLDVISEEEGLSIYNKWIQYQDSLTYKFTEDTKNLFREGDPFNTYFAIKKDDYPPVFQMVLTENISIESFLILDTFLKFSSILSKHYKQDFLYNNLIKKIEGYRGFFLRYHDFDDEKIQKFKTITLNTYKKYGRLH
jgi:hypothetical protein